MSGSYTLRGLDAPDIVGIDRKIMVQFSNFQNFSSIYTLRLMANPAGGGGHGVIDGTVAAELHA